MDANEAIKTVGIIGAGQMGNGIAHVISLAGYDVVLNDLEKSRYEAAIEVIKKNMSRQISRGLITEDDMKAALGRIRFAPSYEGFADCDLVIEAVNEDEALKLEIFRTLDRVVVSEHAILASNTSSIPITRLAAATGRPGHVIGMHFFNPVPLMGLMELVSTVLSHPHVEGRAEDYAERVLGKTVVRSKDRAGFIVNLLLVPYLLGAIRMFENGFATAEDIDTAMRLGANHPMGPLQLSDFVGLDTMLHVANVLYLEFREPTYAPPPLLSRMVEAGHLGRKTGRGFYEYG